MFSLRFRTVPSSVHSSHLPTRHLAVKPWPWIDVGRFLLPTSFWGEASGIGGGGRGRGGGGDGNLPFGGGGGGVHDNIPFDVGGGSGGDVNISFGVGGGGAGGGDEGNASIEGVRVLDSNRWIRYLRAFNAPLLAGQFFSAKHILNNAIVAYRLVNARQHAMNLEGAEASSCDGKNDEKHAVPPIVLNKTMNSTGNYSYRNSGPETMRMRPTHSSIHIVDIGIPDENEKKMKGRRGFSFNIAVGSLAYSMALIPYWTFCCSNTPLGIFGTWMGILPTAHAVVTISSLLLVGAASHFKEGELPENRGFKVLKIVQLWVLLWLWAASFIPLRVCRGISNSVVWPFASAAVCMIMLSWTAVFQRTEMVIKRIKTKFEKVSQWLRNPRLPECITPKFKKMRGKQRGQSQTLEMV